MTNEVLAAIDRIFGDRKRDSWEYMAAVRLAGEVLEIGRLGAAVLASPNEDGFTALRDLKSLAEIAMTDVRLNCEQNLPHRMELANALRIAVSKADAILSVSASPQPRCPQCKGEDLELHHLPVCDKLFCRPCGTWYEIAFPGDMAQFFATAPAQESDSDLLARYNRAYSILGEALNLNAEFYGLVEMTQVAANRLTGKYDSAAQEQPVENSPCTFDECDKPEKHGYHIVNEGLPINLHNHSYSPQKGKP